jgi:charged multivesicular body protein 3
MLEYVGDTVKGWFHTKTLKEIVRENKKMINRSMIELRQAITIYETGEKQHMAQIKHHMKNGKRDLARMLSVQVSKNRAHVVKCHKSTIQLETLHQTLETMGTQDAINKSIFATTKAMRRMNMSMNVPALANCIAVMEKEMQMNGIKQEMMEDAMDGTEDADEEITTDADQILDMICSEMSIGIEDKLATTPYENPSHATDDDEIQERFNNFKSNNKNDN